MTRIALITRVPCREDAIEYLNGLQVDYIIGLGDVECPQYLNNYYGILGEMDEVTIMKYLRKSKRLITDRVDLFSVNFSTDYVLSHFSPRSSQKVMGEVLQYKPKVLIHGHSENQEEYHVLDVKVISVGSFEKGYYLLFENGKFIKSQR
jgi:hypothetical protein